MDKNQPLKKFTYSLGTIKGQVPNIPDSVGVKFILYDSFYNPVTCYLAPHQIALLPKIWGKYIWVTGRVMRDSLTGYPIQITQIIDVILIPDVEEGTYKMTEGIFAAYDDGELPELA